MAILRTLNGTIVLLFAISRAAHCATATAGQQTPRLPETTVRAICTKYEGRPAFDDKGGTTRISCKWVREMSTLDVPTPIKAYRTILKQAYSLENLPATPLPSDIDCGRFKQQEFAGGRKVVCQSDHGELVPFVFVADSNGRLVRIETVLDYKSAVRDALQRSVARGNMSKFYDPYIDLRTDLMIAKLRFTASKLDSVKVEGERISLTVAAP